MHCFKHLCVLTQPKPLQHEINFYNPHDTDEETEVQVTLAQP